MSASTSSGWWTTRSGPSATISSSSSVTRVAISTMTSLAGSSPVISRSIHTSTAGTLDRVLPGPGGHVASARRLRRPLYAPAVVMELPITRLDPDLPLPAYARPGDAGLDLLAREDAVLAAGGGRALVPDRHGHRHPGGLRRLRPAPQRAGRCATASPCLNSPGLIDAGYRDELKVLLVNTDPRPAYEIHRGDRIAQLVVQRVEPVAAASRSTALDGANRGGGFGHTGR